MTTVIATSAVGTATAYSNQRRIDRTSNSILWAMFWDGSSTTTASMQFRYSSDNGSSWATPATGSAFGFAGTGTTYIPNASLFIDQDDYAHVIYKDRSDGYIYYRRGIPNAGRTAWTWSSATAAYNVVSVANYPDLIVHREGTGWKVHIVFAYSTGGDALWRSLDVASSGTVTVNSLTTIGSGYSGSSASYPSIDFNHVGDGKSIAGGTPHLYVAWSAGTQGSGKGIRFKKAAYSGGAWTWGTERQIDSLRFSSVDGTQPNCLYDGTRVIIGGILYDGINFDQMLYERDAADTTTTTYVLIDNATTANRLAHCTMSYDDEGNVHMVGRFNDGTDKLGYYKWTRATTSLSSMTTLDTGVSATPYPSAKRGYSSVRIEYVYTDGTANPYSVTYDSILLNDLPSAPTNLALDEDRVLSGSTVTLSWQHNDPNGDPQEKFQVRYRKAVV